jgi:hypothetical protein
VTNVPAVVPGVAFVVPHILAIVVQVFFVVMDITPVGPQVFLIMRNVPLILPDIFALMSRCGLVAFFHVLMQFAAVVGYVSIVFVDIAAIIACIGPVIAQVALVRMDVFAVLVQITPVMAQVLAVSLNIRTAGALRPKCGPSTASASRWIKCRRIIEVCSFSCPSRP